LEWRQDFIRTFLERNLQQFGVRIGAPTLRRFWTMLAHYHGQLWNGSELGRAFGVSDTTVRHYLDILNATFMVRVLLPWRENVRKRQVKAPKVYIADSGILHALLDIDSSSALEAHPKVGASWEGFMLETVVQHLGLRREQCYFWRTLWRSGTRSVCHQRTAAVGVRVQTDHGAEPHAVDALGVGRPTTHTPRRRPRRPGNLSSS